MQSDCQKCKDDESIHDELLNRVKELTKQIELNEYDIFPLLTLTYKWVFQKFGKWLVDRKCKFREWKLEPLSLGATSKDPTAFQFG